MLHKCNILNWCIDNFATFLFKTCWKGHAMTQNQLYRAFRIAFQSFKRCQIHHLLKKRAMKSLFWCFSKEPEKPGFWNWKPGLNPKPGFWKSSGFLPSLFQIHHGHSKILVESRICNNYWHFKHVNDAFSYDLFKIIVAHSAFRDFF